MLKFFFNINSQRILIVFFLFVLIYESSTEWMSLFYRFSRFFFWFIHLFFIFFIQFVSTHRFQMNHSETNSIIFMSFNVWMLQIFSINCLQADAIELYTLKIQSDVEVKILMWKMLIFIITLQFENKWESNNNILVFWYHFDL